MYHMKLASFNNILVWIDEDLSFDKVKSRKHTSIETPCTYLKLDCTIIYIDGGYPYYITTYARVSMSYVP